MKDWFEEWETNNNILTFEATEKIFEEDAFEPIIKKGKHKERSVARVRNFKFKHNLVKKYHRNTILNGYYSLSLFHYYMPDNNKPTDIRRMKGDYIWRSLSGFSFKKCKKKITNKRIRKRTDVALKGRNFIRLTPIGNYI